MFSIGKEIKFSTALKNLLELDYDAIEAYEAAINRLENTSYKEMLGKFKEDHDRHVKDISQALNNHNEKVPGGPDMKQWLTKGKVLLGNLIGDKEILMAMVSNEIETNKAYENICERDDIWDDASEILENGLKDERRHKAWLEEQTSK